MSISFDDDTCGWYDSPVNNFFITNDSSDKFLFGKGEFKFIEWEPRTIVGMQMQETPSTKRNSVFLVDFSKNQIIFFKPKPEYNDIWQSDLANDGLWCKRKALDVLTKLLAFGIFNQNPFFVSMDTPLKTKLDTSHYWHQDNFSNVFMPLEFQKATNVAFGNNDRGVPDTISHYTIIEYTSECASTSVRLPGTYCDYARFEANSGTAVCVNNIELTHSSPIIDETLSLFNRNPGNKRIRTTVLVSNCEDTAINRFLYRSQIKIISENAADAIIGNTNIEKITIDLYPLLSEIRFSPFQKFTLSDYLTSKRYTLEAGGARKRKTMRKRKKKHEKTKRTKNKRRKMVKRRPFIIYPEQ